MTKVNFVIPEVKRRLFDEQWEKILPSQFKQGKIYTAIWFSESPFTYFNTEFLYSLPNEYREKLTDLCKKIKQNK
jgi:hypothetical protein